MADRNHATEEGSQLGEKLAEFCDKAEPKARLRYPDLPPRCSSCAFRKGPHLANNSPYTQMDALKCVMEGVEFHCHQHDRNEALCSGWQMMLLAKEEPDFVEAPWPWSFDEAGQGDKG